MNFLKAFGAALLKITQLVYGITPPGGQAGPVQIVVGHLGDIARVITDVEAIGQALNLSGDQMLIAEVPRVSQLVLDALHGLNAKFQIRDEATYRAGVEQLTNGLVLILKSGHESAIETKSLT